MTFPQALHKYSLDQGHPYQHNHPPSHPHITLTKQRCHHRKSNYSCPLVEMQEALLPEQTMYL